MVRLENDALVEAAWHRSAIPVCNGLEVMKATPIIKNGQPTSAWETMIQERRMPTDEQPVHITIETVAGTSNTDHAGRHWSGRAEQAKGERWLAKIAALQQTEPHQRPFPVVAKIICTVYFDNKRRRDAQNIQTKSLIDGLVDAGVLVDDNWRYVRSFESVWAYDKKRPRVEIEIRPYT